LITDQTVSDYQHGSKDVGNWDYAIPGVFCLEFDDWSWKTAVFLHDLPYRVYGRACRQTSDLPDDAVHSLRRVCILGGGSFFYCMLSNQDMAELGIWTGHKVFKTAAVAISSSFRVEAIGDDGRADLIPRCQL
jgi:hypothetical protein